MLIKNLNCCLLAASLFLLPIFCTAQDGFTEEEQAELDALDAFLTDVDSASMISLLDSLVKLDDLENRSQLALKLGYNSESIIDNRESLGTENGLFSGITYYHKSGLFLDVISFWNSQFEPKNYLTTTSIGYLGTIGKKWSVLASYEHYFFNENAESEEIEFPFTDGLNASVYFVEKYFELGADYTIIFGDTFKSHKLNYSVTGNFTFKNVPLADRLTLRPAVALLWGNQIFTRLKVDKRFINPRKRFSFVDENVFGLMNIGFILPAYLQFNSLNVGLSYQFNLPQELDGEDLAYTNSNVFNLSLSYFIKL
ncbi:hypothetical protein E1176_06705 [Fulvivirga sp. RKSG066]|uniref:hypothetical protein n=1 Tax=Fulvivirga aurantia TaxID=2529383 RepID=UPI0012BC668C|nr:hypothetical protein [Fulvivirga aurantia]MTI20705.1 hypothetical protein [Fulvivirga aurantia]